MKGGGTPRERGREEEARLCSVRFKNPFFIPRSRYLFFSSTGNASPRRALFVAPAGPLRQQGSMSRPGGSNPPTARSAHARLQRRSSGGDGRRPSGEPSASSSSAAGVVVPFHPDDLRRAAPIPPPVQAIAEDLGPFVRMTNGVPPILTFVGAEGKPREEGLGLVSFAGPPDQV